MSDARWPTNIERLQDIIVQRPLAHELPPTCPWCASKDVTELSHWQTSLGGGFDGSDTNHHWRACRCQKCLREFCYQHKHDLGWYTQDGRFGLCVKGVAGCFESVIYTCAHCGGEVVYDETRAFHKFSMTPLRPQRDPYICKCCGRKTEADDGGHDPDAASRRVKIDFTTSEGPGVVIYNPRALKQLDLMGEEHVDE